MRLKLEGKLTSDWVLVAEKAWNSIETASTRKHVIVDLCGISFVDGAGEHFLGRVCAAGAMLIGADPMIRTLIEEIQERTPKQVPAAGISNFLTLILLTVLLAAFAVGCGLVAN